MTWVGPIDETFHTERISSLALIHLELKSKSWRRLVSERPGPHLSLRVGELARTLHPRNKDSGCQLFCHKTCRVIRRSVVLSVDMSCCRKICRVVSIDMSC